MSAVNITLLEQFCKDYKYELLKLAVFGRQPDGKIDPRSTMAHVTILPGIKDQYQITTLEFQRLLKPYATAWSPIANEASLVPRVLQTHLGQVELEEEPLKYRKTYMGKVMTGGVNPTEHPFEQDFVEGIVSKVAEDVELELVWKGIRNPVGTAPGDVNDGFLKIIADEIAATNISVANGNLFNTGAITAGNALDQLKAMYRNYNAAYRSVPVKMYMSYQVYDYYVDDYQATVGSISYNTQFEQLYLEGSNRLCELVPVAGLGNSQRVIISPQSNMFVGVDLESDAEQVIIRQGNNPKTLQFFLAINFGVQIGSLKAIMVNDQA
jgi:hypothetical protein